MTKFWSLNRRQGGGKYTHRAQFLELFESFWFYRDRRLQKPNLQKIRTIKTVKLWSFVKGSQEVFETVSNQSEILSIFPSVYLFVSLSLSLSTSYLSIDYIITISKMWFKCCPKPQKLSYQSDAALAACQTHSPWALIKILAGCGDRLQHQICFKNLPSIKS